MYKTIDARGRSCPEPVLITMEAIKKGEAKIKVLVDTNIALENIKRLGQSKGYSVNVSEEGSDFEMDLSK